MRIRARARYATVLAVLTILAAACEPIDDSPGLARSVSTASTSTAAGAGSGCQKPGRLMKRYLPEFRSGRKERTIQTIATNPCPPFSELLATVDTLVPAPEPASDRIAAEFRSELRAFAGHYLGAAGEVRCLYQADRLAIGIYQHEDHPWSIGVIISVQRSFGAAVDAATCYLLGHPADLGTRSATDEIQPKLCIGRIATPGDVVVLRFGTSTWMCDSLEAGIDRR